MCKLVLGHSRNYVEVNVWQSPIGKQAVPHWASMLRWIWPISEYIVGMTHHKLLFHAANHNSDLTRNVNSPLDKFGTVVGENPDCLLLFGTVVGENPDHVCRVQWPCDFVITVHPDQPPNRPNLLFHILIFMLPSCYWWLSITLQNRDWGLCSQIWFLILPVVLLSCMPGA